jgi:hypothetical protein
MIVAERNRLARFGCTGPKPALMTLPIFGPVGMQPMFRGGFRHVGETAEASAVVRAVRLAGITFVANCVAAPKRMEPVR